MIAHARRLDAQHPLLLPRKLEVVPVPLPPPPPPCPYPPLPPAIAAKLTSGAELVRSLARQRREEVIPTTFAAVDALLGGGLARGKMTEVAGRGARWSMVIATLAAATSMGEAAALVDLGDHFDPQLAEAAGVDLGRLLWVRPKTFKDAVTAAEMLGATGFQLVVLDAGLPPLRGRRVPDAAWVRLARTCETHGCTLLVSAPYAPTAYPCPASPASTSRSSRSRRGCAASPSSSPRPRPSSRETAARRTSWRRRGARGSTASTPGRR